MTEGTKKILSKAGKFKYPLIVLLAGILLMLLPTGRSAAVNTAESDSQASRDEERMEYVLSGVEGAGEVRVLLSDGGAVVVCSGADDARVRLELTEAVKSFTGFGSDRITILKIQDKDIGEAAA
jgi:hypothetical protein